jgi:hypothetical protein
MRWLGQGREKDQALKNVVARSWFLHVRAALCSAKVLFCLDDFGVELLVLALWLFMKTRVLVMAESFLHC